MVRPRVHRANEHQCHQQKRASGVGVGRGEQTRVTNSSSISQSSPSCDPVLVSRWSTSGDGLSNSASAPSGVGLASQGRAVSAPPENHHGTKGLHTSSKPRGNDCGRSANEADAIVSRSNSLGSFHSQARAQTVNSMRRTSSSTSEAFGNGGGGMSRSNSGSTNGGGVSVAASNDPDVLKVEIHRLQAALMNEFRGGNRFIGAAQFKASNNSRGGHGGAGGNSCGGCLQVRAHVSPAFRILYHACGSLSSSFIQEER